MTSQIIDTSRETTYGEYKTFLTLGVNKNSMESREGLDYYATEPKAMQLLLEVEDFSDVWECAVGGGHLAGVLKSHGILRRTSDVVDRMCGGVEILDFLSNENKNRWCGDIVTNPPSRRLNCAKNGDFKKYGRSAICYRWFVWEKGYAGDTTVKWLNQSNDVNFPLL